MDFHKETEEKGRLTDAEHYRASAEMHKQEVKATWSTFWTTGVFVLAALAVLFFIGLAWILSNSRVTGGTVSVGVQSNIVRLASKGYRQKAEMDSDMGLQDGTALDYNNDVYYYTEDGEIAMRLSEEYYVCPGARGSIDFYIIPVSNGARTVTLYFELDGYQKNESGKAVPVTDQPLEALLRGHILLFENYENGFYSGWLPDNYSDGILHNTITVTLPEDAQADVPYPCTIYWIWPKRYENIISHRPDKNDLFADNSDEFRDIFLPFVEAQASAENTGWIGSDYSCSSLFVSNIWPLEGAEDRSKAYNLADEYIGTNADYLYLTIRTSPQEENSTGEEGMGE